MFDLKKVIQNETHEYLAAQNISFNQRQGERRTLADHPALAETRILQLEQQRDELLAVLKDLLPEGLENCCDECGGNPEKCFTGCAYPIARAAIAKIEATKC